MITSGIFIDIEALDPEQAKLLSLTDFEMLRPDCRETYHKMYPDEYQKLIKKETEAKTRRISLSNDTVDKSTTDASKVPLHATETPTQGSEYDVVSKPKHYTSTSIECIDAMTETQGVEAVKSFCVCNAFKYLWRHNEKNGDEDIRKASWYLNKAIELIERGVNLKTKFELGEEVYVKGKIMAVSIGDKGKIEYRVRVFYGDGTCRDLNLKEDIVERRVQQ